MLVVQLREEADAPPPLYGVSGLGAADPQAVEEGWEGLSLGAPEGAVSEVVVGGGGHGGSCGVSGGHVGWIQVL